jgi:hypothetical protein
VIFENCVSWCTSLLHIVPARVAGVWQLPSGELTLTQQFQMVSGTLSSAGRTTPLNNARVRGDRLNFTVSDVEYTGRVKGDRMEGSSGSEGKTQTWTATRKQ